MDRKNELLLRVYLVFFGFVLFALIIIGKVVKTSLFEGDKWRALGGKNIKWIEVEGERGDIYDVRGNILATSLPYFDIYMDLVASTDEAFNSNIDGLSKSLAQHFGKTAYEWKSELVAERKAGKMYKKPGSRYYPILKRIRKDQLEIVKSMPLFNLGRYKGGLRYERHNKREKPFKNWAARTIGLDRQNADKIGIEGAFDKFLSGETEKRLMRRLPGDTWLPVMDPEIMSQKRGGDIVTTLDMHIQDICHHELMHVLTKWEANAGVAIVTEVKTGEIKAISNLGRQTDGSYLEDYNYAIGRSSEPGSTFKLMSALAMLDGGHVNLDDEIVVSGGKRKFYDRWMYDSEMHGHHTMTFMDVFKKSSNVGMANAAFNAYGKNKTLYPEFYKALKKLGVMDKTGIEIEGEPTPFFKNPMEEKPDAGRRWYGTTVPWMAHGYELKMTPLQVLNFYAAVANDGKMMKPFLVKEIYDEGKLIQRFEPQVKKENIADPSSILKAQQLLQAVAESGTGQNLKIKNTSFAGKTGTTRLNYWKQSERKEYNASFAGYFPAQNPKYAVIVVVYNPKGAYYGSQVAGPVFQNIVERISGMEMWATELAPDGRPVLKAHSGYKNDYKSLLEYIGLYYDERSHSKWVDVNPENESVTIKEKKILVRKMPDLKGMGLRDATYILESLGLTVESEGVGKVYRQSLNEGATLNGQKVKLYLK